MEHIVLYVDGDGKTEKLNQYLAEGWVLHPEVRTVTLDVAAIYHLVRYTEVEQLALEALEVEVKRGEFEDVVDVKSAEFPEVEGLVKEGYVVQSLYAKNVLLIKRRGQGEQVPR